jgi:Mn-dependent DtxR family transcriptional regulator
MRLLNYIFESMNEEVWKEFNDNPLSHSEAHYLMTVHELEERKGYARATDIAKALNISAPSCTQSLKKLLKKNLVKINEDKFYLLTDKGRQEVILVEKNKEMLLKFFTIVLGVSFENADTDSCKIEHLLSKETSYKLCQFMGLMQSGRAESESIIELLHKMEHGTYCNKKECETCPHKSKA